MKKQRSYGISGKYLFLAAALSFALTGCGSSAVSKTALKNDSFEAYKELDAGNWDKAIALFEAETKGEQPEYMALLGLAKAQIGAGDWESAEDTLKKTTKVYPEEATAFIYQGETARQLEDYDLAAESYYMAVKLDMEETAKDENHIENVQIRDQFVSSLDQAQDLQSGYEYAKELYTKDTSDTKILGGLLWTAAKLDSEEAKAGVKEAVAGQPQEYVVTTLIQACDELKAGNKEAAQQLLFDPYHVEDWEEAADLRFGYPTEINGEMMAAGGQKVFGKDGVMFGTYVNGSWNGECVAGYGRISDTTRKQNDVEYKGKSYFDYRFSGNFSEGVPEGTISYREDYHSEYEGQNFDQYFYIDEGSITFADGKAQGRCEITGYSVRNGGDRRPNDTTVHEFKDGEPQPFSADTEDGTKMVYEFTYSNGSSWSRYEEQACSHSYIWKK